MCFQKNFFLNIYITINKFTLLIVYINSHKKTSEILRFRNILLHFLRIFLEYLQKITYIISKIIYAILRNNCHTVRENIQKLAKTNK